MVSIYTTLHIFCINQFNIFPQFNTNNKSVQFWLIARGVESISFLLTGLFINNDIIDFSFQNKLLLYLYVVSTI
ncbi:MAG: MASE3 domain-containing protein, partial [Bacteroidota bacterium]